jgi:hypothetical protein
MVDCDGLRCGFDVHDYGAEALGVFCVFTPLTLDLSLRRLDKSVLNTHKYHLLDFKYCNHLWYGDN